MGRIISLLLGPDEARQLVTVVVTTKTGQSIKGVLIDRGRNGIVLRAPLLGATGQNSVVTWEPLGGDVVIPVENIDYYQQGLDLAIATEA